MEKVLIVGSGASGVHFALTALQKGYEVSLLDVGHKRPGVSNPEDNLNDLKSNLDDPVRYFLGEHFEGVIYPDFKSEYYGFPPSKNYVFNRPDRYKLESIGFEPLASFAQGGLGEVWTAGVYPFDDEDLQDFPFSFEDIQPYYSEVAKRIGVSGIEDDLARFFPLHENIMGPLTLDEHSSRLLDAYVKNKKYFNEELGWYMGRSRVAVLSRDKEDRKACSYSGRCLWGCPTDALYTPLITLNECKKYPNFRYIPDMYASHFQFDSQKRITSLVSRSSVDKKTLEFPVEKLVLAAGTLSSSKIFLDSIYRNTGEVLQLDGLMDNRQILMPFLNLKMVMKPYNPESYQYHQIALSIENGGAKEKVHGLVTTLKTAMLHPIVQKIPLDLRTANFLFRNIRAGLGILNINFHDYRRPDSFVTLEPDRGSGDSKLLIKYSPKRDEKTLLSLTIKKVKKALRRLGCIVPPGMTHIRPMGASVHYSGTIPMRKERHKFTTSEFCQSYDFKNLFIVDGTTFPYLPAKNLTFTLMANASRTADHVL